MSIFTMRRSVRHYDENYKIERTELNEILSLAMQAPSSGNLQPSSFIVVESLEAKEKIRPHLYGNQLQLDTSSAMIIITTNIDKYVNGIKVFDEAEALGFIPSEVANRQRAMLQKRQENYNLADVLNNNYLDAGLIAMQLMLVAKDFGYDTCAMTGFNKETILSALNINDDKLIPIMIVSIGKAKEPGFRSYRRDLEDITTYF